MVVDERARNRLFQKLEAVLGPNEASILMAHLPPVGWADVATKRDVDALTMATKRDLDAFAAVNKLEHEALKLGHTALASKDDLRDLQHKMTMQMIAINGGSIVAVAALAFAAAKLV
jgi:hypothetical protein